jgi:hypothetical protein
MSYAQWCNSYTFFVYLDITLILVLVFYSGLSGGVRTVYLFSLGVVLLLSSRFNASALVWFSNSIKYLVFHFLISLSTVFIYRSSWILWLFMYQGEFRIDRRVLDWKRWEISMLELYVLSYLQANSGMKLLLDSDHFLPVPFQFIIHQSAYQPTIYYLSF